MSEIRTIHDTPVVGASGIPISSNWAQGHAATLDAHTKDFFEELREGNYHSFVFRRSYTTLVITAGRLYAVPIVIARSMTFDRIAINITAGNVADYTTGTAAFTNGSNQVVGTTTVWVASHVGARIKNNTDAVWHTILSVEDNTHLTLTANYSAAGGGAAAYTINHTAKFAIYNDTGGGALLPSTNKVSEQVISIAATGIIAATISQQLTKGGYWLAVASMSTPTVAASIVALSSLGLLVTTFGSEVSAVFKAITYSSALPDPFGIPTESNSTDCPTIALRLLTLD